MFMLTASVKIECYVYVSRDIILISVDAIDNYTDVFWCFFWWNWEVGSCFSHLLLWWQHMHVMTSQITGNFIVMFVQELEQANNKIKIKDPHYWPFVRGCTRGFSSQIVSKAKAFFPHHDIIMYIHYCKWSTIHGHKAYFLYSVQKSPKTQHLISLIS